MRSEYSKWFWSECDELNKDTSFAHSLAEKAWNHRQTEVDELKKQNAWLSDVAERENKRANNLQLDKTSTTILLGKTIQEKNELQKRVDDSIFILSTIDTPDEAYKLIDSLLRTLRGEQAFKGESNG